MVNKLVWMFLVWLVKPMIKEMIMLLYVCKSCASFLKVGITKVKVDRLHGSAPHVSEY